MLSAKRIVTIAGTLFSALGIGFFMQNSMKEAPAPGVRVASVAHVQDVAPLAEEAQAAGDETPGALKLESITLTAAIPVPPSAAPQPDRLPSDPVTLAALRDEPIADLPEEEPAPSFGCEIAFAAQPVAAAMVRLMLSAPCMTNERFTVHHNGMMFAAATDAEGVAKISVPALNPAAIFIVTFATGASAVASADVGTLEYYDRAVVQWAGPEGLQLHALEYGADYGGEGHVWAGAAHDMARAARGEGGFLTRLGDPGLAGAMMAEVYTFPAGTTPRAGRVRLSLEAEVTGANCGRELTAQALRKSGTARMEARDVVLSMPDCEAAGDYLVLKNLFDDLNIARN